ncbi:hypothetical protein BJ085DRAFT_23850 [Dimargaris cristalligena]|uniref:Ribosomal protein bL31m N-terminal domain-containing protein n=1 Tax=Dimargaris cristalligena TaxID=215637 RepID=A0A4P9ZS02_9FUNG|nr:hypothetical protein BJ085DRAFT_23850 [Dimargaris cristalligena]|eukprot:RKP35968.1 hypothetical protein BJ085DRAFT_23850 [Dimargaris cristalligena]
MASAIKKKKYTGPTTNPEIFSQRVVLTDGSTITLRTTSPKSQLKLTKDTRNHPLWNPTLGNLMSDDVDHLQRFSKFSDLEGIETLSDSVSADAEADLQELKRYADEILKKNQESKTKN